LVFLRYRVQGYLLPIHAPASSWPPGIHWSPGPRAAAWSARMWMTMTSGSVATVVPRLPHADRAGNAARV